MEAKWQIWQKNQAFFCNQVCTPWKQYILEESEIFNTELSVLRNFISSLVRGGAQARWCIS